MTQKRKAGMPWFRAYAQSMLRGSVAHTMSLEEQMVWWKLLALARESKCGDGTLRFGWGVPMTRGWIAHECGCKPEVLDRVIQFGMDDQNLDGDGRRIKVWEDGTIELCNFRDYNPDSPRQITLPPEEPPPKVDSDTKRRAIHDKYQREHPVESRFHLDSLAAGVPDTFPELAKKARQEDQRFIRRLKRDVKVKGPEPLPRFGQL